MWRVTLRDIRDHFGRFLMSVLDVTIGVAFLCGTFSLRDLLSATFSNLTTATMTEDLYINGAEIAQLDTYPIPIYEFLSQEDVDTAAGVEGVELAFATHQADAVVYDEDGKQANIVQAPAFAFNYVPEVDEERIVEGRGPERGEIVLELSTSVRSGIEVGDTVHVVINEPVEMEVVGLMEFASSMAGASIISMDEEEMIEAIGDAFSQITVVAEPDVDLEALKTRLEDALPETYSVRTTDEVRAEIDDAMDNVLNMMNTFLLVFVAIALVISTFIIANTFTISVRQRQRQFALLRAVGASPRQVFQAVILQAIVVGIIGSLLGVLAGQGLLYLINSGLESWGMPLDGSVVVTPQTAAISIVVGVIVTFLATILPSRRAALTPAIEAMREGGGQKEKPLRARTVVSALLLVGGTIAMVMGALDGLAVPFGVGVGAMFVGLIGFMPALVAPVVAVLGWIPRKIAPATGVLASRALVAGPRKTATTAAALAIGVALVAAGSSVAASLEETNNADIDTNMKADVLLIGMAAVQNTDRIAQKIEEIDGVSTAGWSFSNGYAQLATADGDPMAGKLITAGEVSVRAIEGIGLVFDEGSVQAIERGEALIYDNLADEAGVGVGDEITLTSFTGSVTARIGAIVQTGTLTFGNPSIMLPADLAETLAPAESYRNMIVVYLEDGVDQEAVKAEITRAVKDQFVWQVADRDDIKTIASGQVNSVLAGLYALLALSVVIAVIGVVNTFTLSVVDRTREIGLLRAVGMQKSRVRLMIMQESIIITLLGTVVGVVFGVAIGLGLTRYMADDVETTYVIPWAAMGIVIAVALVVGVLAAVLPARKAAKLDVLAAIAEE